MSTLRKLAQYIDNQNVPFILDPQDAISESKVMAESFQKVYTKPDEYNYTFRSSAVGKHPFMVAWDYFFPSESDISFGTRFKFLTGYAFESSFSMLLRQLGIKYESQVEISFQLNDFSVGGHPDYVIECPESGSWILETKCVNTSTFNSWKKLGYVDRPEYQMQLALYCLRNKSHGCFVVANVDDGQIALYPITYQDVVAKFKDKVLVSFANCSFIKDCTEWVQTLARIAPPECPRRKDGTYYFPMNMYRGQGRLHPATSIYNYTQREDGTYVVQGYNYPLIMKEYEPRWS